MNDNFKIMLIDDEPAQIKSLSAFLKRRSFTVLSASSGPEGLAFLENGNIDLVLTDFRMPEMNGLQILRAVKQINPEIPVIVITAFSDTSDAVKVMKEGAFDYLSKPVNLDELELLINKVLEHRHLVSENKTLRAQLKQKYKFDAIISQSGEMEDVLNTAGRIARSKAAVLIRGESGTGKELIARAIHFASDRRDQPMITVNCAALSENLLESELFGHEKGAFTGAISQRIGRFEQAHNGSLFIDEIGDLPLHTQVKLLRALQFGEFERVGGSKTIKVNARVITATSRNLERMIKDSLFREDLFYRINVVSIYLPSLRARKSDIPILIRHFIEKYNHENDKNIEGISKEAQDYLMRYNFPGNVRELENLIERAVVMARDQILSTVDFPAGLSVSTESAILDPHNLSDSYSEKVAAFEKTLILQALELQKGNQSQAAKLLGLSERHLRSRMQAINIVNTMRK
ncbi:MAG: sigma-54-dependent Fis family transcriptional regulator [Calditrichales bacterium]|nr:MAG: sigma-54-dependent Fis family transcriptional regulator [Calditrichales bacterium]